MDSDSLSYTYAQNLYSMNSQVLASVSANGAEYTFTHDLNGNMTHGPDLTNFAQPGTRDIAYNADDMPLSITDVRGGIPVTTSFLYDGGADCRVLMSTTSCDPPLSPKTSLPATYTYTTPPPPAEEIITLSTPRAKPCPDFTCQKNQHQSCPHPRTS